MEVDYARLVNATGSGTVPTSGSYVKIKKASTGKYIYLRSVSRRK